MTAKSQTPARELTDSSHELSSAERAGRRWLPAVIIALLAVGLAAAAFLLVGDDAVAPEDVVVDTLEAFNARDRATYESFHDPDIVVSIDATQVGGDLLPDEVGRATVVEQAVQFWAVADPIASWEVVSIEGRVVTIDQTTMFPVGSPDLITSKYTVSEDGLITRIEHVILGLG